MGKDADIPSLVLSMVYPLVLVNYVGTDDDMEKRENRSVLRGSLDVADRFLKMIPPVI